VLYINSVRKNCLTAASREQLTPPIQVRFVFHKVVQQHTLGMVRLSFYESLIAEEILHGSKRILKISQYLIKLLTSDYSNNRSIVLLLGHDPV
jgi:hypothetical protein